MKGRWLVASVASLAFLWATSSSALTTPTGGAVLFPSAVKLVLPFPAGAKIRVSSGYSPSGGSSLHDGTNRTSSANDYYAFDLVYDGLADGGLGKPVLAPLAGTVVKSGWASAGWANYGQRVILRHDLGDGHVYHSIYCHLNAIAGEVTEGAKIAKGARIGDLGRSCMGALSCSSFSGPHLHWAIHRNSTIGGSGTGGSYGGLAVVPEPFDGEEDLKRGVVITSTNTGDAPVDAGADVAATDTAIESDTAPPPDVVIADDTATAPADAVIAADTEAPATAPSDEAMTGCACHTTGSRDSSGWLGLLVAAVIAASTRARRARPLPL